VDVHAYVGPITVDARPLAFARAELIADRVLGLLRQEAAVAGDAVRGDALDRERAVRSYVSEPVDGVDAVVQRLGVRFATSGLKAGDGQQDAARTAREHARAIANA
jgi:hypothetical protein